MTPTLALQIVVALFPIAVIVAALMVASSRRRPRDRFQRRLEEMRRTLHETLEESRRHRA